MKRLIVCSDGTWQSLESPYPTNVMKIAQAIDPIASDGTAQIVFYDEGIGTGGKMDRISGGVLGKGIDKNIQECYRFLCLNYSSGDEIYLFGFSRGAYTVRSLAGLMYNSGLLERPHIRQIPKAYELYRDRLKKPNDCEIKDFRQQYSFKKDEYDHDHLVPITLLACWDTVGSLGIPDLISFINLDKKNNEKYQFHDCKLSPIIKNALHAVAVDEQRSTFDVSLMEKSQKTEEQKLIQKWFPGDHGCVGGGSKEQSGLSDATLKWMVDSLQDLGLDLEIDTEVIPTGVNPEPTVDYDVEPKSLIDKLTKIIGKKIRNVSHDFDDLHESVKIRWKKRNDYRPVNLKNKYGHLLDGYSVSIGAMKTPSPSTSLLFIDEPIASDFYLAIHTVGNNGDIGIWGQITPVPVPELYTILGTGIPLGVGALFLKSK